MANEGRFQIWRPSQRGVLIAFVLVLSLVLLVRLAFNRQYISDPQPAVPARFEELADRLDPNGATWGGLAGLPPPWEKRGEEIGADPGPVSAGQPRGMAIQPIQD